MFERATTYTCLLFLAGNRQKSLRTRFNKTYARATDFLDVSADEPRQHGEFGETPWLAASSVETALLRRLEAIPTRLASLAERSITGVKTGANNVFVFDRFRQRDQLVDVWPEGSPEPVRVETDLIVPYVKAESLKRYEVIPGKRRLLYPYRLEGEETVLIPEGEMKRKYPRTWQYLQAHRNVLEARQKGKLEGPSWYGLSFASSLKMFLPPKIVTPTLSPMNAFAVDQRGHFFPQGAGGGCGIVIEDTDIRDCLIYILNSALLTFYFQRISSPFQNDWYAYEPRYLARLPIVLPTASEVAQFAERARLISTIVQRRREARRPQERIEIDREIDLLTHELNATVNRLYGVTRSEEAVLRANVSAVLDA